MEVFDRLPELFHCIRQLGLISLTAQYQRNGEWPRPKIAGDCSLCVPGIPHFSDLIDLFRGEARIPMFTPHELFMDCRQVCPRHVPFRGCIRHIILVCSRKQVLAVAARWVVAGMAGIQRPRIIAEEKEQGYSMRINTDGFIGGASDGQLPIATSGCPRFPRPALIRSANVHVFPKSGDVGWRQRWNWFRIVSSHLISFQDLLVRAASGDNHPWPNLHYSTEVC